MVIGILGCCWGDEGKGKIVDYLCQQYQINLVVRCQGGNNAGHTIHHNGKKIVLRTVPSGIIDSKILNVIGHCVVIDPKSLVSEILELEKIGIEISPQNLLISLKAHLIMPWHKAIDQKDKTIGTTGNGIGQCYASKMLREGFRLGDFLYEPKNTINKFKDLHQNYKNIGIDVENLDLYMSFLFELLSKYKKLMKDINPIIQTYIKNKGNILLEGAQGVLLDLDHGTYPYVTSSNTSISGLLNGSGISPKHLTKIIGITKSYITRVGSGPFPTEDFSEYGEKLQILGNEFGSVTGRKRRCGHLDLVLLKYANELCGFNELVMTKWDIIENFDEIKLCTYYILPNGQMTQEVPFSFNNVSSYYEIFKDPKQNKETILSFIENFVGTKITVVSSGELRNDITLR